jgi:hypothetical protein
MNTVARRKPTMDLSIASDGWNNHHPLV